MAITRAIGLSGDSQGWNNRQTVTLYAKPVKLRYQTSDALWYPSAGPRLLRIVVVPDPSGRRHLRIKASYGTSENAVKTQIWIAVSVYVLVAIVRKRLGLDLRPSPRSTSALPPIS